MYKLLLFALLCAILPACGHEFAGQTYRVEGGRQVSEFFGKGSAAWKVSGEYRFEQRRCQNCHGGMAGLSHRTKAQVDSELADDADKYILHAILEEMPQ